MPIPQSRPGCRGKSSLEILLHCVNGVFHQGGGESAVYCVSFKKKNVGKKASRFMEKCRVRRDNKATDAADIVQKFFYSLDRIPILSKCSLLFHRW